MLGVNAQPETLAALRAEFGNWVEESRQHTDDYGETLDGRARFDLEPGHSAERPALRRVQSPEEVSDIYAGVMRGARTVDLVANLIGPAIRFHHGKVNSKLPGAATKVKFHQDFTFQPMTNDDMITALLFVDEVTAGALACLDIRNPRDQCPVFFKEFFHLLIIIVLSQIGNHHVLLLN